MNPELLKHWFENQAAQSGLPACGMFIPDQTWINYCPSLEWAESDLVEAWRCVTGIAQHLQDDLTPPQHFCCVFSQWHLHLAIRPDGLFLAALCAADPACGNVKINTCARWLVH